jgi:phage terminase large subunit-like protein
MAGGTDVAAAVWRRTTDVRVPGDDTEVSPATIELDAAMRAGRLRQDGNPVLEWCLSKANRRGNLHSAKQRSDQKTDAAIALMTAIGWAMSEDETDRNLASFCHIRPQSEQLDHGVRPTRTRARAASRPTTIR